MATTDVQPQVRMIALEQIRHDANVRELASEDVDSLAGSIALLGQITPAIVRPDGDGYLLVAGHKRYAALQKLGRVEIRAEVRTGDGEHSERAAENIVRTQLNPYEEARAVAAMLANSLTEDGAAQALGWPKARVTPRMRLLELPDTAQQMVGDGQIALSSVEQLRAIGQVSLPLLDALIAYLADGNQFAAERLAREPGWVIDAALRETDSKVFAAHLSRIDGQDVAALRLGKKTEALYERAVELARQLDRYSYGADVRFSEVEVDQARAAGVVIEFERGWPLIVDRSLYRELVKQAIARTVTELEARVAERAAEKQAQRHATAELPADPGAHARREAQRAIREIAETAHGVNLDLGAGLLTGLSTVDPADMTVVILGRYVLVIDIVAACRIGVVRGVICGASALSLTSPPEALEGRPPVGAVLAGVAAYDEVSQTTTDSESVTYPPARVRSCSAKCGASRSLGLISSRTQTTLDLRRRSPRLPPRQRSPSGFGCAPTS